MKKRKIFATGKECPNCLSQSFYVIEGKSVWNYKRRRRCCEKCGYRATTYEVSKEDFELIREILRKKEEIRKKQREKRAAAKAANQKVCANCVHWKNFECGFEFPDAGGIFAEECSLYERSK